MIASISREAARRLRPAGAFHLPPRAQPLNAKVELIVEDSPQQPEAVITDKRRAFSWRVRLSPSGQPNEWRATVQVPSEPTILTYQFEFADGTILQESRQLEGENKPIYGEWEELPFKIAVYDPARMPADWTQGMVLYQIFPDRFANGDPSTNRYMKGVYGHEPRFHQWGEIPEKPPLGRDFYGGDLRGVIDHLDYLVDLGVECIYFCPIFDAPTNHRYDAIDYFKIDPMLGTEADFDELVAAAHARNLRIVLDAVFNHCSSDSLYFDITNQFGGGACDTQESPYYRWFDFQQWPSLYRGWYGLGFMPEFVECPEVEEFFCGPDGVTAYWLKKGIDGWRCDVAFDNTEEFWRRFRKCVDATKPGAYTVSEEWRDSTHYFLGDSFSATMNYRFTWAARGFLATDKLSPSELDDRLNTWLRDTPAPAVKCQMNQLDSHDTGRILTACGGDRRRLKQIVAFQFAYPGAPQIYYGSETGLEGDFAEDGRRTLPWDHLDQDLIGYFKRVIALRRESAVLRLGEVEAVVIDDAQKVYAFRRWLGDEVVYCAFNAGDDPAEITLPLDGGGWRDVLNDHRIDGQQVRIDPRGAAWIQRGV